VAFLVSFPQGNMMEQQTAQSLKEQAIQMIAQGLSAVCFHVAQEASLSFWSI
jgi:hypothetical protein